MYDITNEFANQPWIYVCGHAQLKNSKTRHHANYECVIKMEYLKIAKNIANSPYDKKTCLLLGLAALFYSSKQIR